MNLLSISRTSIATSLMLFALACKSNSTADLKNAPPAAGFCAIDCEAGSWESFWSSSIGDSPRALGQVLGLVKPTVEYRWFNRETHPSRSGQCGHVQAATQNKQWAELIANRYYPDPTSATCKVVAWGLNDAKLERMEIEHYQKSGGVIYHWIEYEENRGGGLRKVNEVRLSPKD